MPRCVYFMRDPFGIHPSFYTSSLDANSFLLSFLVDFWADFLEICQRHSFRVKNQQFQSIDQDYQKNNSSSPLTRMAKKQQFQSIDQDGHQQSSLTVLVRRSLSKPCTHSSHGLDVSKWKLFQLASWDDHKAGAWKLKITHCQYCNLVIICLLRPLAVN